jgi:hypothetical protein
MVPLLLPLLQALIPDEKAAPAHGKTLKMAGGKPGKADKNAPDESSFAAAFGAALAQSHSPPVILAGSKTPHPTVAPSHAKPQRGNEVSSEKKVSSEKPCESETKVSNPLRNDAFSTQLDRATSSTAEVKAAEAPAPPLPITHDDYAWQGAILPHAANLHVDMGIAGSLALHLQLRDGLAQLRMDGTAAPAFAGRESELRQVMSATGVSLTHLDVSLQAPTAARDAGASTFSGQSDQRHQSPQERPEGAFFSGPVPAQVKSSNSAVRSVVHIEA